MENSIIFLGKFDNDLLSLEENVINICKKSKHDSKYIHIIKNDEDIKTITPDVKKYTINEHKFDVWAIIGDVKPTLLLKNLIASTKIILFVFNLKNLISLDFLNEGWFPIFEKIDKSTLKNQERFLIATGNDQRINLTESDLNKIQTSMNIFNCQKFFEYGTTNQENTKYKNAINNISYNLINDLRSRIQKIEEDENMIDEYEEEKSEKDVGEFEIFKDKNKIFYKLLKNNLTAEIIESPDARKDIIIPTFIKFNSNKYKIIRVCDHAFQNAKINSLSFEKDSLIEKIGSSVFENSTIRKLSIPPNLIKVNSCWIDGANELEEINVNRKNEYFSNDDDSGFIVYEKQDENDKKIRKIIFAPRYFKGKYLVPGETTSIGRFAFSQRQNLLSFKSDFSSLKLIESYCFYQCENLENFIFKGKNDLTLGAYCFSNSIRLKYIDISCKSIKIGKNCFSNCSMLSNANFQITNDVLLSSQSFNKCVNLVSFAINDSEFIKIGKECFSNSPNLKSVAFKAKSVILSNNIFDFCDSLTYIFIQSNEDITISSNTFNTNNLETIKFVTSKKLTLNDSCFANYKRLNNIELDFNSIEFGNDCFLNCLSLSYVTFKSNSDLSIFLNTFNNNRNLKKIILKTASKLILNDYCFKNFEKLENIGFNFNSIEFGNDCFSNCLSLSTISIQSEYNSNFYKLFSENGFNEIKNLKKVIIIGENVIINNHCFKNCLQLQNLLIKQASKVYIEQNEFFNNKTLKMIKIESNSDIELNKNGFFECENLEMINIIGEKILIEDNCFQNCKKLNNIVIADAQNVTLGSKSFLNCSGLEKIELKVKSNLIICNNCFGNTNITNATFEGKSVQIGSKCFEVSSLLKSYKIETININCDNLIIGNECFKNCSSITSFSISPAQEIYLGMRSFEGCKKIESINLKAENKIELLNSCFSGSKNLKSFQIESKDVSIGNYCFQNCSAISHFLISSSNEVLLGTSALEGCYNLEKVVLNAENKLQILNNCFSGATKLKIFEFNSKEVIIYNSCFYNCSSLKNFTNQNSNTIILYEKVFDCCYNLEKVHLTSNIEFSTGRFCFANLRNLEEVIIKSSKVTIGDYCFFNCLSLKSILFPTSIEVSYFRTSFYEVASKPKFKKNANIEINQSIQFNQNSQLAQLNYGYLSEM